MKEIILVRHGEPDFTPPLKISGKEIPKLLKKYNEAPLTNRSIPPKRLRFLAHNSIVICSDLPRSVQSAKRCGVNPDIVDPLFEESIPPHFQNDLFRLSPKNWLIFSRIVGFIGFSNNGESFIHTKKRAKRAADILIKESKKNRVLLFGHALFNIFIARELIKAGFIGKRVPAKKYWEFGNYRLL